MDRRDGWSCTILLQSVESHYINKLDRFVQCHPTLKCWGPGSKVIKSWEEVLTWVRLQSPGAEKKENEPNLNICVAFCVITVNCWNNCTWPIHLKRLTWRTARGGGSPTSSQQRLSINPNFKKQESSKDHRESMRCPEFRNYDVSPSTKHKRGIKSQSWMNFLALGIVSQTKPYMGSL